MQLRVIDATEPDLHVTLKSTKDSIPEQPIPSIQSSNKLLGSTSAEEGVATSLKPKEPTRTKLTNVQSKPAEEKLPPNSHFLNQLKTGNKMKGIVASSTAYAAFINAKVYRAGKGGMLTEVNGMLHKNDISPELLGKLKKQSPSAKSPKGAKFPNDLLEKGTEIDVYVKEVYKNSG